MFKKFVSLMLVVCVMLTVCITASAAGVEPAKPADGKYPITITGATCEGRTVTVKYTIDAAKKVDGMDVTVLFYSPVGPEGEEKYITYNDGETEQNAIYYADQVKYDNTDKLVFSLPGSVKEGTNYNVLVGGTDIDYPGLYEGVVVPAGFKAGDANLDGSVKTNDATTILKHCVKMITIEDGSTAALAADVTADGVIKTNDATKILKYCAKMIDTLE